MEENNQNNSYKMVNFSGKEKNIGAGRSVVVPFVSGVVGACLVVGACFGIPSVKEQLLGSTTSTVTETAASTVPTISTSNAVQLTSYSDVGAYVANKVMPSIVGITVEFTVNSIFGQQGTATSSGSGIILTEDGHIITNNHVISGNASSSAFYSLSDANKITVKLYGDDNTYEAKVIGSDERLDIAVIKIDKTGLTAAELGNSEELTIGEFALVAGNPLGLEFSVTSGSISSLNREITDSDGITHTLIQTDAAINSGNSGGALVNSKGQVVGISFMKIALTDVEGICFAIPITPNLDAINQIITTGKVAKPYLGIDGTTVDASTAKRYNMVQGVYIQNIYENSGAAQAGLQAGDIIVEMDGKTITSMDDLDNYKYTKKIGETIKIKVNRNGETLEFDVVLGDEPTTTTTTTTN